MDGSGLGRPSAGSLNDVTTGKQGRATGLSIHGIDPEFINAVIAENLGSSVRRLSTIPRGEINDVYGVTLSNGQQVIARFSRSPEDTFSGEAWAIAQAAAAGVPVPAVLTVGVSSDEIGLVRYSVQERVAGSPFDSIIRSVGNAKRLTHELGEIVAKLHAVRPGGYGYIYGETGSYPDKGSWISRAVSKIHDMGSLPPGSMRLAQDDFARLARILEEGAITLESNGRLIHGDLAPPNVIIRGGKVRAVIDFEEAASADPSLDFATWAIDWHAAIPTEWLLAGYAAVVALPSEFDYRLRVMLLYKAFHMLC